MLTEIIVATTATALAGILTAACLWLYRRYRESRVIVKRILSNRDRDWDLFAAYYEAMSASDDPGQGIGGELVDSVSDISRWLEEMADRKKTPSNPFDDIILLAKCGDKAVGLLFATYYHEAGLGFISYLYCTTRRSSQATAALLMYLARNCGISTGCHGFLFEVEKDRTGLARLRLFAKLTKQLVAEAKRVYGDQPAAFEEFSAYRLGVDYIQPRVNLSDERKKEEPLYLVYVPLRQMADPPQLTRAQAETLLTFVYRDVYGDQFRGPAVTVEEERAYEEYLHELSASVISELPEQVQLFDPSRTRY